MAIELNNNYIAYVSENIGTMFEYAVAFGFKPKVFWNTFVNSNLATQIEKENPKYLTGYSAIDLTNIVINTTSSCEPIIDKKQYVNKDMFYWAGWAIANYQHYSGTSFYKINKALPIERVLELYPTLHEADITKFYETANKYVNIVKANTNLKIIRHASGLSQSELAKKSGVLLRSIQMYEQRKNDINKAQVETLLKLSKILNCNIEDLLED